MIVATKKCALALAVVVRRPVAFASLILVAATSAPANANNYGESLAWQFSTSADRVNQAALLDLIQKRRGGYYAAPVYNTTIARQYNCSIAPVATGNSSGQSAVANSPSVTGASASATGNANSASATGEPGTGGIGNQQSNSGSVGAGVNGSTNSVAGGTAWQTLNSSQTNSGSQTASVQSSSACAFGTLN